MTRASSLGGTDTRAGRRKPTPLTAARLVADLEELAVAGAIDAVVVRMVREGLFAIADAVRALPARVGDDVGADCRSLAAVLELLAPDGRAS